MTDTTKKPWFKRWWAITLFVVFGLSFLGQLNKGNSTMENPEEVTAEPMPETTETTEITSEDQVREAFLEEFSSETNMDEQRIREISIWQDTDGTNWVTVNYNADENLTANMMRSAMWRDAVDFYEKVTPLLSKDFNGAVLIGWLPTTDVYGNAESTQVMTVTMSRATWEKITWDSFLSDNIPVVADLYVESPIFGN